MSLSFSRKTLVLLKTNLQLQKETFYRPSAMIPSPIPCHHNSKSQLKIYESKYLLRYSYVHNNVLLSQEAPNTFLWSPGSWQLVVKARGEDIIRTNRNNVFDMLPRLRVIAFRKTFTSVEQFKRFYRYVEIKLCREGCHWIGIDP